MTNEEALNIIRKNHIVTVYYDEDVPQDEWHEAIRVAKAALERQIRKPPLKHGTFAECPHCLHMVTEDMAYCDDCGQGIEWRRI